MALTKVHNRVIEGSLANIIDYGAVEGSSAAASANTTAIQAAINSGKGILIPVGDWYFDDTLTNPNIYPVTCYGKLIYTGDLDNNAFEFGAADGVAHQQFYSHVNSLYIESDTQSDFTATHGAGIALINVFNGQFSLGSRFFRIGILAEGNVRGFAYNQVTINRIQNCEIGLFLHATNGGYANENVFWGGRFMNSTSYTGNIIGVNFSATSGGSVLNNNVFYKPSFEITNGGSGSAVCFSGDNATLNTMYGGRMEMTGYFLGGSIATNNFEVSRSEFSSAGTDDILLPATANDLTTLVNNNIYGNFGEEMFIRSADKILSIGRSNVVGHITGGAAVQVQAPARGVFLVGGSSPSFATRRTAGLQKDHIVLAATTTALGCVFDLTKVQRDFLKRIDVKFNLVSDGGRLVVQLWDSSGNLLAPSSGTGFVDNPYCSLDYRIDSSYEWYQQGGDRTVARSEERVTFGEDVAYAFVGIAGATANATVRQIEYYAYTQSDIVPVYDEATLATLLNAKRMADIPDPVTYATDDPESSIQSGNSYSEGLFARRLDYTVDGNGRLVIGHMYDGSAWQPIFASTATWT